MRLIVQSELWDVVQIYCVRGAIEGATRNAENWYLLNRLGNTRVLGLLIWSNQRGTQVR